MISSRAVQGVAVALAISILAPAAPALAQGTAQQRSACMGDALRFCARFIPKVSAITGCLEQNVSRLRPACAAEFASYRTAKMHSSHFARSGNHFAR